MAGFLTELVAAGFAHTCTASAMNGALLCWGYNSNGQLGLGNTMNEKLPVSVSYLSGPKRSGIWPSRGLQCIGHWTLASHICQFTEPNTTPTTPIPIPTTTDISPYIITPLPPGAGRPIYHRRGYGLFSYVRRGNKRHPLVLGKQWKRPAWCREHIRSEHPSGRQSFAR